MARSIFGWDLPPGVSTSDLPGNSREEQEVEAFVEGVYEMLGEYAANDEKLAEVVATWALALRGNAYSEGYQQGMADAEEAKRHTEQQLHRIVCSNTLTSGEDK